MRLTAVVLALLAAASAEAHPSFVPHTHPHGISMLPDLGTFVVGAILLIAATMVARTLWRRE